MLVYTRKKRFLFVHYLEEVLTVICVGPDTGEDVRCSRISPAYHCHLVVLSLRTRLIDTESIYSRKNTAVRALTFRCNIL
jgi:hypothetical protein